MLQKIQQKLQEKYDAKENSQNSSDQDRQRDKMIIHKQNMRMIQHQLKNEEVVNMPVNMKHHSVAYINQYLDEEEKFQYSQIKQRYFKTTYAVSGLAFLSAFIFPLPFKSVARAKPYKQFFILWFTIFGVTHYIGMAAIRDEVDKIQNQLIEKYKDSILTRNYETID